MSEVKELDREMSRFQFEQLTIAMRRLRYISERDCDCCYGDHHPTDDETSCDTCQAKLAMQAMQRALRPQLEGLHPARMTNYPERIYVERWRVENELARSGDSIGLLRLLLQPEGKGEWFQITTRDAAVATTIIQWLGTPVGRCFVSTCERQIEEERKLQRDVIGFAGMPAHPQVYSIPEDEERRLVARQIATTYISIDKHPEAAKSLEKAILSAWLSLATPTPRSPQ